MAMLFDATTINSMTLRNRAVRSATWAGLANEDGTTNHKLNEYMAELARGGVGLIITGLAYVSKDGQTAPWQLGIDRDKCVPGLKEMTDAVHDAGGKIAIQISHGGIESDPALTGYYPQGPSVIENIRRELAWEMTEETISRICKGFGHAAGRAREAGFDAVQLHGAHGWLLSQFLSSHYNKRGDGYGGSLENKARLLLEIMHNTRASVGNNFPVIIKLNSSDYLKNGVTIDEMIMLSMMLEKAGIDAIEMTGGTRYSGKYTWVREGRLATEEVYYKEAARRYKQKVKVPLMLVGGIRSYPIVERLLSEGITDYVSFSRPLIREPGLINRWRSGDTRRATCLSDNLCRASAFNGQGLCCVVEERLKGRRVK